MSSQASNWVPWKYKPRSLLLPRLAWLHRKGNHGSQKDPKYLHTFLFLYKWTQDTTHQINLQGFNNTFDIYSMAIVNTEVTTHTNVFTVFCRTQDSLKCMQDFTTERFMNIFIAMASSFLTV
jgi:hypothetical protein